MNRTGIEWCDFTWNPMTGCSRVSEGCRRCYAERMAKRLAGRCGYPKANPFAPTVHPGRLEEPLKYKRPALIFAVSMGDFFCVGFEDDYRDQVLEVIGLADWHVFVILTKREEEMARYFEERMAPRNLWLGVSVEDEEAMQRRFSVLARVTCARRVVSWEPALGPLNDMLARRGRYGNMMRPDWLIFGPETGPGARPAPEHRAVGTECVCWKMGIPFFDKRPGPSRCREWPMEAEDRGFACVGGKS